MILIGCWVALIVLAALFSYPAWSTRNLVPLDVRLGTRSVSKFPFVIAHDQGLFEKYGLNVTLWMPPPEFTGTIDRIRIGPPRQPDITVDGTTPMMVEMVTNALYGKLITLAGTDCIVDDLVIGGRGIQSLEELKGKRIGTSSGLHTTTTFSVLVLAQRMGWDPVQDISILKNARLGGLRSGVVDAFVGIEGEWTEASLKEEGFSVLADMGPWNEPFAGTGIRVEPAWLEDPANRDAARRFIMAAAEGIALFYQDRELALEIMARWHGYTGVRADLYYAVGTEILPRKPYPCYAGIEKTMELYDSNLMRRYRSEDFYDDSLVRELDESGFFDGLYRRPTP